MKCFASTAAIVILLSMNGFTHATTINWVGGNGTWYVGTGVWDDGGANNGSAFEVFGGYGGWTGPPPTDARAIIGGPGSTVYYDASTAADFAWNAGSNANGGAIVVSNGGTFNMDSNVFSTGSWMTFDAEEFTVTGTGSKFDRYNSGATLNGGALIFGSLYGYDGQIISINVLDSGEFRNKGQTWFGAYGDEQLNDITLTIGEGATFITNGALENSISVDNSATYEGEFNFIYTDFAGAGYNQHDYKWIFEDNGGSMTVGVEGIRVQVHDSGDWNSAQVSYEDMWDGITNANVDFYNSSAVITPINTPLTNPYLLTAKKNGGGIASAAFGDLFSDYFAVSGSFVTSPAVIGGTPLAEANYKLTSLAGATAGGSHPGDINGDLVIDAADAGTMFANWGTGTTVAEGDINLVAPGDNLIDAADAGVMFASWTGDPGPTGYGTARGEYNSGTGEIIVSVNGVNNWYVESLAGDVMTGTEPVGIPAGDGALTNNDTRVGETGFLTLFSYQDVSLGNVAQTGIVAGDLRVFWNTGVGTPLQSALLSVIPEPTTLALAGLALCGVMATRRRLA